MKAMNPTTLDAYRLMHEGTLAHAELAGMKIDVDLLDRTIAKVGRRIERLSEELKEDDVWKVWIRRYGNKASIGSRQQLGNVLYNELGHRSEGTTRLGKRTRTDEDALTKLNMPFVRKYLEVEKLKKLRSTNLMGVRNEVVGGMLRPSFNLHLTRTYRPSSDMPNFQNLPIRDKVAGKLIRSCFVPRPRHVLVEIDHSALEVRIAACYHRDPAMVAYIEDPTKDMHRDMAAECYMLPVDQVTKDARFYAKNQFVFPQFYGDYYVHCAKNLWDAIGQHRLKTVGGVPLQKHLAEWGITSLGNCDPRQAPRQETFEHHIQRVEQNFWGRRFRVYARWKKRWYEQYRKRGWFRMLTGFRVEGVYGRNDVINYPVQGSAFHCLLWSLIRLVRWLRESKMRSVVVGQIHDSIIADVHREELDDYLTKVRTIMTVDVRRAWPWIVVPLEIEAEVGEENWFDKRKVEL